MKYSLRSLLLIVTVATVLVGLWGENWRTCLARQREHAEQATQFDEKVRTDHEMLITLTASPPPPHELIEEHQRQAREHHCLAAEYRQAIWQPWKRWWIDESRLRETKP